MASKKDIEYYEANKELIDKLTLEGIELAGDELVIHDQNLIRHENPPLAAPESRQRSDQR